jgi:choline monooxygenase
MTPHEEAIMNKIDKRPDFSTDLFAGDAGVSYTLPSRMYFSPETLKDERNAIFLRSWLYVAHVSELAEPGRYVTAEILDQRLYLLRTESGALKAFFNVCQHRGHSLLHGKGTARRLIMCPYHAWSYDHDGALRAAPNCAHVDGFDRDDFGLPEIRVDTLGGFVFINFDPDARPMAEVYPGAEDRIRDFTARPEDLKATREVVFDIKGNWKNVADNLLECYHCATAHKAFVDLVEMTSYKVELHDNWSIQWGDCRCENAAYDYDASTGATEFCTLFVWPTLALVKFPGTGGLATFVFTPLEPELTHQVFTYHAPNTDLTDTENRAFDYFQDVLGPEDVDLIEDVQKGLHSIGYHQGRFMVDQDRSQISEHAAHHFQSLVARSLGMI